MFGFGKVPGLSEYLSERHPVADLFLNTKQEKLTLLPAGSPPPNPAELLSSRQMAGFLTEVSQKYPDLIVIIDTTPLAMTAEGNTLANFVDAILLVIKKGHTPKAQLKELVQRLGPEKIIGTVFNCVDQSHRNLQRLRKISERILRRKYRLIFFVFCLQKNKKLRSL